MSTVWGGISSAVTPGPRLPEGQRGLLTDILFTLYNKHSTAVTRVLILTLLLSLRFLPFVIPVLHPAPTWGPGTGGP